MSATPTAGYDSSARPSLARPSLSPTWSTTTQKRPPLGLFGLGGPVTLRLSRGLDVKPGVPGAPPMPPAPPPPSASSPAGAPPLPSTSDHTSARVCVYQSVSARTGSSS